MKKSYDFITIIFWIAVIFYLDPGGFVKSSVEGEVDATRSVLFKFGIVAVAYFCFFIKFKSNENKLIKDDFVKWYIIVIFLWAIYYFLWFYGLNNSTPVSLLKMITRNQRMITQMFIAIPIAYFASINLKPFIKVLGWSTVIIMIMFLLTIFSNLELVTLLEGQRGMGVNVTRYFMEGYGITSFTVPLALTLLFLKFKNEKIILLASVLVALQYILSIYRRDIIGIFEHMFILAFLVNYISKGNSLKFISRFVNLKSIFFGILVLTSVIIFFPRVAETAQIIVESTFNRIVLGEGGETATDDARLSLTAMYGTIKVIEENLYFGTGYLREFFAEQFSTKGIEGSDYIFLTTIAMYGVVGLLIFFPFYLISYRVIFLNTRLIQENIVLIKNNPEVFIYPVIVGLAASSEFIKNLIEYPNWFWPIGADEYSPRFFIYFGLLVGSYYQLKKQILFIKLKKYKE